MDWLRFLRRSRWDAEREAEIAAHLQMQMDELVADGMSPDDARAEAGRRFGNPRVVREEIYDMNSIPLFETLARDARYAVRVLRKAPLFTAAAVLTLGVAIAINTAMFSVVDAVLLLLLPYPDPARLAVVSTTVRQNGNVGQSNSQTGATWEAVAIGRRRSIGRRSRGGPRASISWPAAARPTCSSSASAAVSSACWACHRSIGREFSADEDRAGGPAATVLSHALWHSMFAADPAIVGRTLLLRGESATIVGVMPRGFDTGDRADLWTPLRASTTGEGEGENYAILTRVHADWSWASADAEMRQIGTDLARQERLPEGVSMAFSLVSLQESMTADFRSPLLVLWAAVAIVLLVACVNLAGLLLARAAGRTRELRPAWRSAVAARPLFGSSSSRASSWPSRGAPPASSLATSHWRGSRLSRNMPSRFGSLCRWTHARWRPLASWRSAPARSSVSRPRCTPRGSMCRPRWPNQARARSPPPATAGHDA